MRFQAFVREACSGQELFYERLYVYWDQEIDRRGELECISSNDGLRYLIPDPNISKFSGYAFECCFPVVFLFLECHMTNRERFQPMVNHREYDYNGTLHKKKGGGLPTE